MHSDIDTLERIEIRDLRRGEFDVLVGINLLREGLDLPEVSLVAILDADKEGFLRNDRSLIQTIGRAARNADGQVILYADKITRRWTAPSRDAPPSRDSDGTTRSTALSRRPSARTCAEIIEISRKDEDGARRRGKRKLFGARAGRGDPQARKADAGGEPDARVRYAAVLRDPHHRAAQGTKIREKKP